MKMKMKWKREIKIKSIFSNLDTTNSHARVTQRVEDGNNVSQTRIQIYREIP